MISKPQASAKLYLLVFVMSVFIIGIGVFGIHEMKTMSQNTETLYADRVFPLQQLTTIRLAYVAGILSSSQQVQTSQLTFRDALKKVEESEKSITSNWQSYMLTYLTPEEKQLAEQASALMDHSTNVVEKLKTVMNKEDIHDLDTIVKNDLYPALDPVVAKLSELIGLQVRVSGEVLKNSNTVYNNSLKKLIVLIVLSLIFAIPFSYYLVKSVKDLIHDLQISNKKIAESERKSRALIENAGDAIFMANKDTFITDANDYACRLLGYSREELLRMKISEIVPQEELKKQVSYLESINKNVNSLSERRLKRKDGGEVDTEINTRLLKGEGYISIIRDISERKEAEEALRKSEGYHRLVIDTIPALVISARPDGSVDFINQTYHEFTGLTLDDVGDWRWSSVIHPDDREKLTNEWRHALTTSKPMRTEFRQRTASGEYPWMLVYAVPLRDESGNIVRWYGVLTDITELKQVGEELRRLTEHLQKIREEERIRIAREIHDELGQQLTAVKMDVAWIDKKTSGEMIDIKKKLKNVIQLLDGSNQSIRRILSELRPRVLDDHGLLEALQWLSRQFAETTGIPIQFTTTEVDLKVQEQISTCIFRVCQEAFTNIMRHSHAKNISTSIKIIEENIILAIEDDGVGFDAITEQNKKTFGILGMKERVLSLGGKFELVSSPGNGTKLTITLPYNT